MKHKVRFIKEYITTVMNFFSKRIFYIQNPWTKTWIYRNRTLHKRLKFTSQNNKLKNKFYKKAFFCYTVNMASFLFKSLSSAIHYWANNIIAFSDKDDGKSFKKVYLYEVGCF